MRVLVGHRPPGLRSKCPCGLMGCVLHEQVNSAPARGPDHFPFQGFRDSGIGSQGIKNSLAMMVKDKTTVLNLAKPSYTMG